MNKNTALLILDVQKVFFSSHAPIHRGEEVLKNILSIVKEAKKSNSLIITTQHLFGDMFGFQIDGTPQGEIRDEIKSFNNYFKNSPNPFKVEGLLSLLRANSIKEIVVTGFQSEYCVDTCCRAARDLGFRVTLISDAHTTYDNDYISADSIIKHTNLTIGNAFAKVVESNSYNWLLFSAI